AGLGLPRQRPDDLGRRRGLLVGPIVESLGGERLQDLHEYRIFRLSPALQKISHRHCSRPFRGEPAQRIRLPSRSAQHTTHRRFSARQWFFLAVPLIVVPGSVAMKRNSLKLSPAVTKKCSVPIPGTAAVLVTVQ